MVRGPGGGGSATYRVLYPDAARAALGALAGAVRVERPDGRLEVRLLADSRDAGRRAGNEVARLVFSADGGTLEVTGERAVVEELLGGAVRRVGQFRA